MQEKTKNASNHGTPSSAGQSVDATDSVGDDGDDRSDDMNAEELAAFDKIMGEIEATGEADTHGGDSDQPVPSEPEITDETPSESGDDFSAELEKVVQAAGEADGGDAGGSDTESSADELDAEQQQAFESIMAQIGGDDDPQADAGAGKETDEPESSESGDDFSAELEKVVQAAGEADGGDAGGSDTESSADELDAEQQQAFESIMAQIGGDDDPQADAGAGKETDEPESSASGDDFSAELEKVAQTADTTDLEQAPEAIRRPSENRLDGEPQDAPESDTSPSKDGDQENTATDPMANHPASESQAQGADDGAQEETPAAPTDDPAEATQDISDDIEDLLLEIQSEDDESSLPQAVDDEIEADRLDTGPAEETLIVQPSQDEADGSKAQPSDESSDTPSVDPTEPDQTLPVAPEASHQAAAPDQAPGNSQSSKTPSPLRETARSTGKPKKRRLVASMVVMLLLAVAAYTYWPATTMVDTNPPATPSDAHSQEAAAATQLPPSPRQPEPVAVGQPSNEPSRLKRIAENLDRLRNQQIEKQAEIGELRAYYQAGIDAEIQTIADTVGKTGSKSISFKSATADPRVRLGLQAIQRRDTYMQKLVTPAKALHWNSETVLYFSRKAALLSLMSAKTSDIDVDGFIGQAEEIIDRHGRELAGLNIDSVSATPRSLESIWQDIARRLPAKSAKTNLGSGGTRTDHAALSKSICSGDYSRKHLLTTLSPVAARCLAQWKGKDLFLNALTELQPDSARQLAGWDGEWLGLNGLMELTPESAAHLSRWPGKGLSLNGLSRLSPRVVAIMSEWQGEQIELVNVKHMAHWENPNTRLLLSEDLQRKLNSTRK